jgi:hypothetical protein
MGIVWEQSNPEMIGYFLEPTISIRSSSKPKGAPSSPLNVNFFIKEPDIFTNRMQYETYYLLSPEMKKKFPELIQKVKDTIKEGEASADAYILDLPCPYVQSNVINQPIWLAAQKFGRDVAIDIYLKAINDNSIVKSYSDFAQRILNNVNDNELLKKYLAAEFIRHGLSVEMNSRRRFLNSKP